MKYLITLLMFVCVSAQAKVIYLTTPEQVNAEFAKPGPIILMYGTTWCPACKQTLPKFEEASNKITNVRFIYMDPDHISFKQHQGLFQYIPFFVVGKDAQELRNKPCIQTDDLKRDTKGFQAFIKKCLGK
jgi:thioredoxin 1